MSVCYNDVITRDGKRVRKMLLNGNNVKIFSVMDMSWPPTVANVKGRNLAALSLRLRGDARISSDGVNERLCDGDVLYMPKGVDYRLEAGNERILVVHFDADADIPTAMKVYRPKDNARILSLFEQLFDAWNKKEDGYMFLSLSLFYRILYELTRTDASKGETSAISESVAYLHLHYTDPMLSVAFLSKKSYMSDTYFRRIFRRLYGKNPHEYLTGLRLSHAAVLLEEHHGTVEEIALSSGFSDAKYFSTVFRKHFGRPPSKYRNG